MIKRFKNFYFIGFNYKKEVKEKDLENKTLKTLIMLKDNEHDYFSVNVPIIISWLWIIISVYTTVSSRMHSWKYNIFRSRAYTIVSITFIARLIRFWYVSNKQNNIINKNIAVYNKIIQEMIEKEEQDKKEYENKITNYLKEINEKLGK